MANWDWEDTDWDWEDTEESSCGEEQKQIISEPEIDKEWLLGILREFHKEPVSSVETNDLQLTIACSDFCYGII